MEKEVIDKLREIVGDENVLVGSDIGDEYTHDESLAVKPCMPEVVVKPRSAEEIVEILRLANKKGVPVTPRGGGGGGDRLMRWLRCFLRRNPPIP
jgi:glycolate oxidase